MKIQERSISEEWKAGKACLRSIKKEQLGRMTAELLVKRGHEAGREMGWGTRSWSCIEEIEGCYLKVGTFK